MHVKFFENKNANEFDIDNFYLIIIYTTNYLNTKRKQNPTLFYFSYLSKLLII